LTGFWYGFFKVFDATFLKFLTPLFLKVAKWQSGKNEKKQILN
jgi:hypothetical protein